MCNNWKLLVIFGVFLLGILFYDCPQLICMRSCCMARISPYIRHNKSGVFVSDCFLFCLFNWCDAMRTSRIQLVGSLHMNFFLSSNHDQIKRISIVYNCFAFNRGTKVFFICPKNGHIMNKPRFIFRITLFIHKFLSIMWFLWHLKKNMKSETINGRDYMNALVIKINSV